MSTSSDKAAQLKAEGNALFVKKEFKQAIQKYGEAINVDGKNAVLYSNRAACRLSLQQYKKAITDAEKATELDPTYSKAWSRLAAAQDALDLYPSAIKSYQRALDTLPKESLKPAELTQKKQYEAALDAVTVKQQNVEAARNVPRQRPTPEQPYIHINTKQQKMPWVVANDLIPDLRLKENYFSSAYLIVSAEMCFQQANQMMYSLRKVPSPMGEMFLGMPGAIEQLSNAVMMDKRVFRLESMEWVQKYNDQMTMETVKVNGPDVRGSAESIIEGIHQMFIEGGFDAARPCASLAVRSIILLANVEAGLKRQHELAVERYDKALAILKWGREQWKDVPKEDRGTVFEDSFVRGVRDMRLEAYMEAWMNNKESTKFKLDDLLKEAEDILAEVRAHPCSEEMKRENPGFALAFWSYAEGHALAMIGFVKNWAPRVGGLGNATTREQAEAEILKSFKESAHAYFEAADKFPEDDEAHVWYLNCGIDIYWRTGIPLKVSIPIMERIRKAHNTMRKAKIWENSAMAMQGRDQALQKLAWFEEDVKKAMAEGQFDGDAMIMPESAQPQNNPVWS